jgi:HK97 family phage portal protein
VAVNIIDRARVWLARGMVKALNLNIISPWLTAAFMEPTFQALCTEGYKANGAVFACASALAFAFPEPRLVVYRQTETGREAQPDHPLTKLLAHPNPVMGVGEFLQFHIIYEAIGGNCYWYKVRDKARRNIELWPLHDGQITPIYHPTQLIDHYELANGTDAPDIIPVTDIIHHRWMPDPLNPARGLSGLVAVAREIDTDNEATRYLFTLLKNDAVPRLALKVPREVMLDDEMRRRLREDWQQKQGGDNRGKVAVLEGGLDVARVGLNLQELAFEAFRRVPEARIAGAMRVPPIVAGLNVGLEQGTYSNYEESVRSFTTRTLVPLWRKVATQATASLVADYGDDTLSVDFDMTTVMALAEAVTAKRQFVDSAVRGGYLTRNEARDELGKPRVAGGDVFLVSVATVTEPAMLETPTAGKAVKGLRVIEDKATRQAAGIRLGRERQRIRSRIEQQMVPAISKYFDKLSGAVVERANGKAVAASSSTSTVTPSRDVVISYTSAMSALSSSITHTTSATEFKLLPTVDELLSGQDHDEFGILLKQFYTAIIESSWPTISAELGITVAFDLTDPAVTAVLNGAGKRVTQIMQTTRDAIVNLIQYGNDQGWSIYDLVRGDDTHPGLADIAGGLSYIGPNGQPISLSPEQRARMIARTELGWAQNVATTERYKANGVTSVGVLDNGLTDDDEACQVANGQTWTIEEAESNPLEHPNCTRCFFAVFE